MENALIKTFILRANCNKFDTIKEKKKSSGNLPAAQAWEACINLINCPFSKE